MRRIALVCVFLLSSSSSFGQGFLTQMGLPMYEPGYVGAWGPQPACYRFSPLPTPYYGGGRYGGWYSGRRYSDSTYWERRRTNEALEGIRDELWRANLDRMIEGGDYQRR